MERRQAENEATMPRSTGSYRRPQSRLNLQAEILSNSVQVVTDGMERRRAENETTMLRSSGSGEPRSPLAESLAAFAVQQSIEQQPMQQHLRKSVLCRTSRYA